MNAVFNREFDSNQNNMIASIVDVFVLLFVGVLTLIYNINGSIANFEYVLGNAGLVYAIIIPILTMKCFSEERKQKTDQLLYSLPLTMTQIVLGKFLAFAAILATPIIVVAAYPLIFKNFGDVYLLTSYGTLIAFYLLGLCFIAVGMFISSLTESQGAAAGITAVVVIFSFYSVTLAEYLSSSAISSFIAFTVLFILIALIVKAVTKNNLIALGTFVVLEIASLLLFLFKKEYFEGLLATLFNKLSLFERFYTFVNGVFDITAIIYYFSITAFFLFLCVQSLEKRRYN